MAEEIKRNEQGEELTDSGHLMYPKWVTTAAGTKVIVKSRKEEEALSTNTDKEKKPKGWDK